MTADIRCKIRNSFPGLVDNEMLVSHGEEEPPRIQMLMNMKPKRN